MDLIQQLIEGGYLKTPEIISAFKKIKREDFVLPEMTLEAEKNYPLSIGYGQTISQPLTVVFMFELLQPKKGQKILDIGSGSGWTTALLAEIVGEKGKVFGIERIKELADFGQANTKKYNFVSAGRTVFITGDGSKGLPREALFDCIHVGAAAAKIPGPLLEQLKVGGRLVIPVGIQTQDIVLVEKGGENEYKEQRFPGFAFVPLVEEKRI